MGGPNAKDMVARAWYGRAECLGNGSQSMDSEAAEAAHKITYNPPVANIRVGMGRLNARDIITRAWIVRQQRQHIRLHIIRQWLRSRSVWDG